MGLFGTRIESPMLVMIRTALETAQTDLNAAFRLEDNPRTKTAGWQLHKKAYADLKEELLSCVKALDIEIKKVDEQSRY